MFQEQYDSKLRSAEDSFLQGKLSPGLNSDWISNPDFSILFYFTSIFWMLNHMY